MASAAMGRMFGDMPGGEHVENYMLRRVRKELAKLDQATLERYLGLMEKLASSIRTGEGFDELMRE